jgi:hypothetical protein
MKGLNITGGSVSSADISPYTETGYALALQSREVRAITGDKILSDVGIQAGNMGGTYGPDIEVIESMVSMITKHILYTSVEEGKELELSEEFKHKVKDLSDKVDRAMSILKEEVLPVLTEYTENLTTALDAMPAVDASDDFKINEIHMPRIVSDYPELFPFDTTRGKSYPTVELRSEGVIAPYLDITKLVDVFYIEDAEQKQAIVDWLSRANTENIEKWLHRIFREEFSLTDMIKKLRRMNALDVMDIATALYLCAKAHPEPKEESTVTNLEHYKKVITSVQLVSLKLLSWGVGNYISRVKNETLVADKKDKEISVIATLYEKYREAGGSVSSLLGNLVGRNKMMSLRDLTNNIYQDTTRWERYKKHTAHAVETKRMADMKTISINVLLDMSNELTPSEATYHQGNDTGLKERLNKVSSELTTADLLDIHKVARKMVCLGRFFFTNAYTFFSAMEAYSSSNKDMEVDEAKLLASVDYVGGYLAEQLAVVELYR